MLSLFSVMLLVQYLHAATHRTVGDRLLDWGLRFVEAVGLTSHLGMAPDMTQATTVAGGVAAAAPAALAFMARERALISSRYLAATFLPAVAQLWRGTQQKVRR